MNIVSRDRNISSTLAQGPNLRTRILRIPRGMSLDELATMGTIKDYLALRKSVFTRKKGWDVWLPKDNDLDQYDQYDSVYVIAQHAVTDIVLGGARLLRTDRFGESQGHLSYMIRDACLGRLSGLPKDLCDQLPPEDTDTWEITRFVTDGTKNVPGALLFKGYEFLKSEGAKRVLYLGPPALRKLASMAGQKPVPLGPVKGNKDGRFQVFQCELV